MFLIFFFRARATATCQTEIMGWRPNIERRGWNFEGGGWGNLSNLIFKIVFHYFKKKIIFQNSRLKLMMVFTMSLWKIMILQMKGKSWVYQLILRVRICTAWTVNDVSVDKYSLIVLVDIYLLIAVKNNNIIDGPLTYYNRPSQRELNQV